MRDLYSNVAIVRSIVPVVAADNTALVGAVVDGIGFLSTTYALTLGTLADVDATFTVLLEHSDESASGYVAVPDESLIGTEALAGFKFDDDNKTRKLGYIGEKRYTRLTITPVGNAGAAPIAAIAILGHPLNAPVA